MKLSELLKTHYAYSIPDGHPQVFGDGYLLRENFVYRNVREAAARAGFKTVEAWPEYMQGALYQLDRILLKKRIPMRFNTRLIEEVESKRGGKFILRDLPELPKSYALHESAHCVADHLLKPLRTETLNKRLLKTLIGESFANAVEAIGSSLAITETHRIFFEFNSYRTESLWERQLSLRVIDCLGFQNAFKLSFYSFLYSNFLYESYSPRLVRELISSFKLGYRLNPAEDRACFKFFTAGTELSVRFRAHTTSFYLKSQGYDEDVFNLLNFNFRAILKRNKQWLNAIDEMARLVEHGPPVNTKARLLRVKAS